MKLCLPGVHKNTPLPPPSGKVSQWPLVSMPAFQRLQPPLGTHVDEEVGVCVLLGGEVVQVGQVLVLGDRKGRAHTGEAGDWRGS